LAGLGDLVLTCSDNQSRNRRFGLALGQGKSCEAALKEINQSVEGYYNTKQIYELAQENRVQTRIIEKVYQVIYEKLPIQEAVDELLARAPREE